MAGSHVGINNPPFGIPGLPSVKAITRHEFPGSMPDRAYAEGRAASKKAGSAVTAPFPGGSNLWQAWSMGATNFADNSDAAVIQTGNRS
jgi:hypothetical protein